MEDNKLEFTIQMEYDDYKTFVRFTERCTDLAPDSRKIVAAGLGLLALGLLLQMILPPGSVQLANMAMGGGGIVALIGASIMTNTKRRKYLRLPATVRAAQHLIFEEDGCRMVSYAAPENPVRMLWNECRGCIEAETHFYIINLQGQTVLLPKRQLEGREGEAAAFLKEKMRGRYVLYEGKPIKIKKGLAVQE